MWVPAVLALVAMVAAWIGVEGLNGESGATDAGRVPVTAPTVTATTVTAPTVTTPAPASPVSTIATRSGRLEDLPGPASPPVRIQVEALAIDAPVVGVGVDRTAAVEVPDDVASAGWYRFGPAPGQPGSSVVTAHVDSATQGRGAFFPLRDADPGTVVTVTYTDGSRRDFEVTGRRSYEKASLPVEDLFARTGPPVLTLITCGGPFDPVARRYEENVVVYAVPVER